MERERTDFAEFYARNRDSCLRAVVAGTGDRAPAEDLVAEAFARAWASWPAVSRHPAPAAWVLRTALNVRVSWWRRREVVLLRIWHDLDTATVAAELGISPSTVAVHLSRATATLRAQFVPVARTRRA